MWDRDDPNGLSHLLALFVQSIKTTCTFSEVNLEATGKDKYKLIASRSVVCATKDFPVNKNEGRKEAFGKTVRLITADKQKRKLLWDAYRVSHKNEAMIIINKIIDYIKKEAEVNCCSVNSIIRKLIKKTIENLLQFFIL